MNSYRAGEAEREESGGRLGNDGRCADRCLREVAGGSVRANMVGRDIGEVINAKGRRFHAVSVRVLGHGGLGRPSFLVEVDGEVTRS